MRIGSTGEARLADLTVGIVGLGLMGGSLALGLKGKCRALIGLDSSAETDNAALEMGAVDELAKHLPDMVDRADVLILAAPVRIILAMLKELSEISVGSGKNKIVMDIGSTKTEIVAAMNGLASGFEPIGAHPICGREVNGIQYATSELYLRAPFVMCATKKTTERARKVCRAIILALGARPLEIDAEEHDCLVAGTSHLPYLVAVALAQTARRRPSASALVGPGFRDTSRLAGSNLEMMADILTTNREPVLQALDEYISRLDSLRQRIAESDEARLRVLLAEGRRARQELMEPEKKEEE